MASLFSKKEETKEQRAKRSNILQIVCAAYLLYLVYQMVTDMMVEMPTGGEKIMVIASCVVFTLVSLVILFFAARRSMSNFKATLDAAEELEREEQEAKMAEELDDDYLPFVPIADDDSDEDFGDDSDEE